MLTLPLDLVLHIVDVGDLDIKDVFNLYNVNKLLRQKLLHPYFWNVLYKRLFASIFSQLEIEEEPKDYQTACYVLYMCQLELEHYMNQLSAENIPRHEGTTREGLAANLPWTSERYQRFSLDMNYLPTLLKMAKAEDANLQAELRDSQYRIDFLRASVIEHLVSNQLYHIGLKNIERINSCEITASSAESMLFNMSLLESTSYRRFHNRSRFFKLKSKMLDEHLKSYTVQTYSTLRDDSKKRKLYKNYITEGLRFLLTQMETHVCGGTPMIENLDVLKLYSHKRKAHPYLLFAVATRIVSEGWNRYGFQVPDLVDLPICTPWCIIHQDTYFDYVNLKLMSHKSTGGFIRSNTHDLMSNLFQLFDLSYNARGLKESNSATIMSLLRFEDFCTDSNFITKMKLLPESSGSKFKLSQFLSHLALEDAVLHRVVFEHAMEIPVIIDNIDDKLLPLRGLVIKNRYNKPVVILSVEELFWQVLTVFGKIQIIRADSVSPWKFQGIQEASTFVSMIGLNMLLSVGFRYANISINGGIVVFESS